MTGMSIPAIINSQEIENMSERAEAAVAKYRNGYNCCQAVTCALADETDMSKDQLKIISTGF